jgi:hypothetical protein
MSASRPRRRVVLAGVAAAAVPSSPGQAHADGTAGAARAYRWRNVVIGGTGFVTGVLFHPAVRGPAYARTDIGGAHRWGWTGETVTGDPRIHGRVHLATNGRGIQYGEPA